MSIIHYYTFLFWSILSFIRVKVNTSGRTACAGCGETLCWQLPWRLCTASTVKNRSSDTRMPEPQMVSMTSSLVIFFPSANETNAPRPGGISPSWPGFFPLASAMHEMLQCVLPLRRNAIIVPNSTIPYSDWEGNGIRKDRRNFSCGPIIF